MDVLNQVQVFQYTSLGNTRIINTSMLHIEYLGISS